MTLHRSFIIATFVTILFGLTACSPSGIQVLSHREAHSQDAVLAIRISPQLSDFDHVGNHGWVALVAEDGSVRAIDVGSMDIGQILWTDDSIYFSSRYDEFFLSDTLFKKFPRTTDEAVQSSLISVTNQDAYVSVYNVGFLEDGYGYRIVAGDVNGFDLWDVDGLYSSIHNCNGRIVGITDATELSKNSPGFIDKKFTNEGNESIDVLRVLYPKEEALQKNYLSVVKNKTVLGQQSFNAPCVNGIAYTLGISYLVPDDSVAHEDTPLPDPVLRAWDTKTGNHVFYYLKSKDESLSRFDTR